MEKFTSLSSLVMPLCARDVDTDQIIPAQYLTSVSREGYGNNLFRRLRDSDPQFPLNLARYKLAQILVADSNFGCGSSREHAVWALQGAGFRAVISKSFADIFSGNAAKNGLLLVTLSAPVVDKMLASSKSGDYVLEIDLSEQVVRLPDGDSKRFEYDPFRKHCLLNGLDDLDYLLSKREEIEYFRKLQEGTRFFSSI